MKLQRWQAGLGLAMIVAFLLPEQGWAQAGDLAPASERELDKLFFSLVLFVAIAGGVSGLATGRSLRMLRHRKDIHFPSRIRRLALIAGVVLTITCEMIYLSAGWWREIYPMDVLTHGKSALIPILFVVLWYIAAYGIIRAPRWSGRYALWPLLNGGRS